MTWPKRKGTEKKEQTKGYHMVVKGLSTQCAYTDMLLCILVVHLSQQDECSQQFSTGEQGTICLLIVHGTCDGQGFFA